MGDHVWVRLQEAAHLFRYVTNHSGRLILELSKDCTGETKRRAAKIKPLHVQYKDVGNNENYKSNIRDISMRIAFPQSADVWQ